MKNNIIMGVKVYKNSPTFWLIDSEANIKFSFPLRSLYLVFSAAKQNKLSDFAFVKKKSDKFDSEDRLLKIDISKKEVLYKISALNKTILQETAEEGVFKLNDLSWKKLEKYADIAGFYKNDIDEIDNYLYNNNVTDELELLTGEVV